MVGVGGLRVHRVLVARVREAVVVDHEDHVHGRGGTHGCRAAQQREARRGRHRPHGGRARGSSPRTSGSSLQVGSPSFYRVHRNAQVRHNTGSRKVFRTQHMPSAAPSGSQLEAWAFPSQTHCRPTVTDLSLPPQTQGPRPATTVDPVFFGTSMGRTGCCHDYMRDKLDGRNLVKVTAGPTGRLPTDPGLGESARRSGQKIDEFEKYEGK